ncbi:CRAL-TRIO domain-containing protein [Gautieria morchelliformis]|nr:CRAL-TRIO domain-containing protein [Gautieria morchelliformis]
MPITIPLPPPNNTDLKPLEPLPSEREEKRSKVLEHFADDSYKIPGIEENGVLHEQEKFWLSNECFIRYLKASKWELHTAIQRLEETLKWRREFGVYDNITAELVEPEAVTGKEIIFGYDVIGRPALYLLPSRQNTNEQTRQIQFTVWMLERCVDLMEPGVGNLALLINFADRAKNPSLGTARKVLNILQSHYPERLGLALIINVPFLVMAFLNLIFPFVDPVTREKVKFNPKVVEQGVMAADQVMTEWDGSVEFKYEHEEYWEELVQLCETRRTAWLQRWRSLGGTVGISEWDYKQKGEENETPQLGELVVNGDL